jgi:hypothetical protein
MVFRCRNEGRLFEAAAVENVWTARMERAACGRIDRAGHVSLQGYRRTQAMDVGPRDGRQQGRGVGMAGIPAERTGRRQLDD